MTVALPRTTPEAGGIPSAAVVAFVDAIENRSLAVHSLMLVRHGSVVAEGWWRPYAAEHPHMLFSLSKTFTSTAVGLAVDEGLLTVDDTVLSFFPDDVPAEVGENLAAMRVRHLLTMSTGHAEDTTGALAGSEDGNWVRAFLAQPVAYEPGTHFLYNSGATYLLSAIVQRLTGGTMLQYLESRLFVPLGIAGATWQTCPRGINTGGWGLSAATEDIARLGLLYLQHGRWQGHQLLSEAWVTEATRTQIATEPDPNADWAQGYGYQIWRSRHGGFRGDGAFGQYCMVLPEQEAVLAITGGHGDLPAVLDLVWEHLLPAMGPVLDEDENASRRLDERLSGLEIARPAAVPHGAGATRPGIGRTYRFGPDSAGIDAVRLEPAADGYLLTIDGEHGEQRIRCGDGTWTRGEAGFDPRGRHGRILTSAPSPIAANGAWTAEDTYTVTISFYQTPFVATFTCTFEGDELTLTLHQPIGFYLEKLPALVGRAAAPIGPS